MVGRDGNVERSCGAGVELESSSYLLKGGGVGGLGHVFMFHLSGEDVTMERGGDGFNPSISPEVPCRPARTPTGSKPGHAYGSTRGMNKRVQKSGHLSGELYSDSDTNKPRYMQHNHPCIYLLLLGQRPCPVNRMPSISSVSAQHRCL